MQFLKNIQFTHLLKINGDLKEVNFRKSNASLHSPITIDTTDSNDHRGKRLIYNMQETDLGWKFLENEVPAWLAENEGKFNDAIQHELAVQQIYFFKPASPQLRPITKFFHLLGFN